MRRPNLPPSVKGTSKLAGPTCKIFRENHELQSLQVEPCYRTSKMASNFYFQNGLFKVKRPVKINGSVDSEKLLRNLGWFNVQQLINFKAAVMVHKSINN